MTTVAPGQLDPGGYPPLPTVSFATSPEHYRHWRLAVDGQIATLTLAVAEDGGLVPGYTLKLNSYDLGVDIELYDALQRLRFEHPQVRAVVLTGGLERMFCAGANIRMLAQSSHSWKVNFCKFTNETRNAIEDATEHSGQTWLAALNGTAAGGGYELALACDQIVLVDDGSSAVSLPEVPLLGVLPGTGGLTRLVDKRHVRRDRADVFATKSDGIKGRTAVEWGLVDAVVPRNRFADEVAARAAAAAATSRRPVAAIGLLLTPLDRIIEPAAAPDGGGESSGHSRGGGPSQGGENGDLIRYPQPAGELLTARLLTGRRRVEIEVHGPSGPPPADLAALHALGTGYWPLALARALDDLVLHLRTNEPTLGTWVLRTTGDHDLVLAHDAQLDAWADDWLVNEIRLYLKRVLKRLDVTSRSLVAVAEPGSCFAGTLLELALACDRQYLLDGVFQDVDPDAQPATVVLGVANTGAYPMGNGLTRLQSRFYGRDDLLAAALARQGEPLDAAAAAEAGLVTMTPDDLDWDDELRVALEERAALSPDALTGMEANHRFVGPETAETKIFGRLSAWQNWIFTRPNAVGPTGALPRYGSGQRPDFDPTRV